MRACARARARVCVCVNILYTKMSVLNTNILKKELMTFFFLNLERALSVSICSVLLCFVFKDDDECNNDNDCVKRTTQR